MSRPGNDEVRLCLPARTGCLSWVHLFVDRLADDHKIGREKKNGLLVAVSEAFTNAIIHGSHGDESRTVEIVLRSAGEWIQIWITDYGDGPAGLPPEMTWDNPDWRRENGRGLHLIRKLTDELELTETEGGGLTIKMGFFTGEGRPAHLPDAKKLKVSQK